MAGSENKNQTSANSRVEILFQLPSIYLLAVAHHLLPTCLKLADINRF